MLSLLGLEPNFMHLFYTFYWMLLLTSKTDGIQNDETGGPLYFNCGTDVSYRCGLPIPTNQACPTLRNDPTKIEEGTDVLCKRINFFLNHAAVIDIFDTKCSFGNTNITSYIQYDTNGRGIKCSLELGCLDCWDDRVVSSGGGIRKELGFEYESDHLYISTIKQQIISTESNTTEQKSQSELAPIINKHPNTTEDSLFLEKSDNTNSHMSSEISSSEISDWPSYVPSDTPSFVPSDIPSCLPSDLPSIAPFRPSAVQVARKPSLSANERSETSEQSIQDNKNSNYSYETNDALSPKTQTSNLPSPSQSIHQNNVEHSNKSSTVGLTNASHVESDKTAEYLQDPHTGSLHTQKDTVLILFNNSNINEEYVSSPRNNSNSIKNQSTEALDVPQNSISGSNQKDNIQVLDKNSNINHASESSTSSLKNNIDSQNDQIMAPLDEHHTTSVSTISGPNQMEQFGIMGNNKNIEHINENTEAIDETHASIISTVSVPSITGGNIPNSNNTLHWRTPIEYAKFTYQIPAIGINAVGNLLPDFATYSGFRYKYTGQCDLVLVRSKSFGNGIGLHAHLRTRISSNGQHVIAILALKIGDDVIEISHLGDFSWNRLNSYSKTSNTNKVYNGPFPINLHGGDYLLVRETLEILPMNEVTHVFTVKLSNENRETDEEYIRLTPLENTLSIEFSVNLTDSSGMLGVSRDNQDGVIGRDGKTLFTNVSSMALEWQVKGTDFQLFSKNQYPQYPRLCFGLPTSMP